MQISHMYLELWASRRDALNIWTLKAILQECNGDVGVDINFEYGRDLFMGFVEGSRMVDPKPHPS